MNHLNQARPTREPAIGVLETVFRAGARLLVGCTFLLGCATATSHPLSGQGTQCLGPDAWTTINISVLDSLANGLGYRQELRDSLGLPTPHSQVSTTLQQQASICAKAATALDSLTGSPPTNREVYVYKLGKIYAVEDPLDRAGGGLHQIAFFTSKWVYLSSLAQ